jgi:hypothetical protein
MSNYNSLKDLGKLKDKMEKEEGNVNLTQKINWEKGVVTWEETNQTEVVYRTKDKPKKKEKMHTIFTVADKPIFCAEVKNKKNE